MKVFKTLLLREWMQHRTGWLVLALLPPAIMLLSIVFSPGQGAYTGGANQDVREHIQLPLMMGVFGSTIVPMACLVWMALSFQVPGLAQRDSKDRSIEFWRALPVSDATALAATLCAHLVLMPLAVMGVAMLASVVLANVTLLLLFGAAGYSTVDLHYLSSVALAALPRLALGSLLASLWASALLLPLMAASAWFKRWGGPMLFGLVGAAGVWLEQAYHQTWLLDGARDLFFNFAAAVVPFTRLDSGSLISGRGVPAAVFWDETQHRLADLGTPLFGVAMLLAATGFALLVLKRRRG